MVSFKYNFGIVVLSCGAKTITEYEKRQVFCKDLAHLKSVSFKKCRLPAGHESF